MTELLPPPTRGQTPVRAMTIAGSDSGGGAGIQADLRTMALCGVHACVAVTAVTVQNSQGVSGFHTIPPETVAAQIRSVVTDIGIGAAKTGMLASGGIIEAVAETAEDVGIGRDRTIPLVVDPVCASMHGEKLLADDAMDALRASLIPLATVVTPNLDEVLLITGIQVRDNASQREAAVALYEMGARWALIKGGHLRSSPDSIDVLYGGADFIELPYRRIPTTNDHGAGDTLSAAMTCALAQGFSVPEAFSFGKGWVSASLEWAYGLGKGHGPVNPFWRLSR